MNVEPAADRRDGVRWRQALVVVVLAAMGLTALLAVVVPAGQPYDEPSHWATVRFYADEMRLPELGEPGVTYEAQMGPTFYVVAAGVVRATGGGQAGFTLVRVLGVLGVGAVVLLSHRLARLLVPDRRGVALVSAAVLGLNPTVVLFSASVQNDTAVLVAVLAGAVLAVPLLLDPPPLREGWWRWALAGLVLGVGVLAKFHAVTLLPALVVGAALVAAPVRRRALRGAAVAVGAALVACGWWFVRNLALYGDPTSVNAVPRTGVQFGRQPVAGIGDALGWVRSIVSTIWLPTEYHRNAYQAPLVLRALAVLLAGTVLVLVALALWRRPWRRTSTDRPPGSAGRYRRGAVGFAACWGALGTLVFVAFSAGVSTSLSPRALYVAAPPLVIGGVAAGAAVLPRRWAPVMASVVVGSAVVVLLWLAVRSAAIPPQVYWIDLQG